jgi:hypothetical protein
MEIDTNPPKTEGSVSGLTTPVVRLEDLSGNLEKLKKTFDIPVELLE